MAFTFTAKVDSTAIKAVHYHGSTQDLTVLFLNGECFEFHKVPPSKAWAMVCDPSPGNYFNRCVRGMYESELTDWDNGNGNGVGS